MRRGLAWNITPPRCCSKVTRQPIKEGPGKPSNQATQLQENQHLKKAAITFSEHAEQWFVTNRCFSLFRKNIFSAWRANFFFQTRHDKIHLLWEHVYSASHIYMRLWGYHIYSYIYVYYVVYIWTSEGKRHLSCLSSPGGWISHPLQAHRQNSSPLARPRRQHPFLAKQFWLNYAIKR